MQNVKKWIREPFCGLSHLAGAVLSVVALVALLMVARGRVHQVVGFSIYGVSMIILYTMSGLYHSLHVSEKHQSWLQRFDYVSIFLMIVGTYAPLCMVPLYGPLGWSILSVVGGCSLIGIIMVLTWKNAPHWIRVSLYIVLGWMAVIALPALHRSLGPGALAWLIGGGIAYSIGTVFYATGRPKLWPGTFGSHDLWHVFVLAGSACHFVLIFRFIGL